MKKILLFILISILPLISCKYLDYEINHGLDDEIITEKDLEWQNFMDSQRMELSQISFAETVAYELTRFESTQPYKMGNEFVLNNPIEEYVPGHDYEKVLIPTGDCGMIQGLFFPKENPKGTIIALHGFGSVMQWAGEKTGFLLDEGYQLFIYNARVWNYFLKPETYTSNLPRDIEDVKKIIQYLHLIKQVDTEHIGLMGFSYGGYKAITAASFIPEIKLVMTYGAIIGPLIDYNLWMYLKPGVTAILAEKWGLSPQEYPKYDVLNAAAALSPRPLLVIHGELDAEVPIDTHGKSIYNAAGTPKEFCPLPSSGHWDALETEDKDLYTDTITQFLDKYL